MFNPAEYEHISTEDLDKEIASRKGLKGVISDIESTITGFPSALKSFATELNLNPNKSGDESSESSSLTIVTLYHPAAALYNGSMRNTLQKDFEVLKGLIIPHTSL